MIIYMIYKNKRNEILPQTNSQELASCGHQMKNNGNPNDASLNKPEEAAMDGENKSNKAVESSELHVWLLI